MDHKNQRKLAIKLFEGILPESVLCVIKDEDRCFKEIFSSLMEFKDIILKTVLSNPEKIPQEWIFQWALSIGDQDLMSPLIADDFFIKLFKKLEK